MFPWSHEALVDIACHALSQSHPGVLKEQRVSCEDCSHPGDVYHPDFQYDRPTYFGLSVCSTTQPCHISYSSSSAGITAAAGELAKDQRHLDAVEEAGCDFFPSGSRKLWCFVTLCSSNFPYHR